MSLKQKMSWLDESWVIINAEVVFYMKMFL